MIKLTKNDYYIQNNKKFFFVKQNYSFQCAACLYAQYPKAIRNKKGLIIGWGIGEEHHEQNCYQK